MHSAFRKLLGTAYVPLTRFRTAAPVKDYRALTGRGAFLRYARRHPKAWAIDLDERQGMGALMAKALLVRAWAEAEGRKVAVRSTNPLYSGGEDIFARWFADLATDATAAAMPRSAARYFERFILQRDLSLAEAQGYFAVMFAPSGELKQLIDAVVPEDGVDLAIHFRGTDKLLETGAPPEDAMLALLRDHTEESAPRTVFLATDELGFARTVAAVLPGATITRYDLADVPAGTARHFSAMPPADKAKEALVNMFCLARAPLLIRTSSYLSAMAALANPAQRTVTVNREAVTERTFPEAQILAREQTP
ncbi:hypothetical protein [Qipengyuania atrilutea]|uniref:Uncharacterized protein n=1 Tax=Qipengyuania atrilutea TaxID=2744473 RepID=A0A850H4H5_9SPHN|nr:hypothetical protein [Actirhodobacter atriluteus]NVD44798.1 hypothetical protein [Actirhodobacter atriluteus]